MPGIKDKVAVIGMGCTKFDEHWDKDILDLIIDCCYEAYEDAGIDPKDIKAGWWSTAFTGGDMGRRLALPLKLQYIPITRIENRCASGQDAFITACYAVACGAFDIVLACGAEKLKDSGMPIPGGSDPTETYTSRVDPSFVPPAGFSQMARRYFHRYGISADKGKEAISKIAVKNHYNGARNPKAQYQREITLEQAIKAPMISPPFGLYDCCGITDGAACAILTRPDIAKKLKKDYVLVKGGGMGTGHYQAMLEDDYDLTHIEETVRASKLAYEEAGITDPRKQLDLIELHDCFTMTELVTLEDLGISPRGKCIEDIDAGTFTLTGEMPVNSDGGLKCFGHPLGASGLRMLYEVYKQLQEKAGPRQVKLNNGIGLAHSYAGTPVDSGTSAVTILGRHDR